MTTTTNAPESAVGGFCRDCGCRNGDHVTVRRCYLCGGHQLCYSTPAAPQPEPDDVRLIEAWSHGHNAQCAADTGDIERVRDQIAKCMERLDSLVDSSAQPETERDEGCTHRWWTSQGHDLQGTVCRRPANDLVHELALCGPSCKGTRWCKHHCYVAPAPAPETPSPEVGMLEKAHRLLDELIAMGPEPPVPDHVCVLGVTDCDGECAAFADYNNAKWALLDAIRAAAKETK